MTHRSSVLSPAQQAERTATENYRGLQAEVIGTVRHRLASRKMHVDESDLEEAYCQAWHGVCMTIKQGEHVSNLTGMLVEITWRRTVDIYRELRPGQRVELELDEHSIDVDIAAQLDDQLKLKRFLKSVRGRLNPRECEAVSLCVIHGYTRPEAAQMLGLQRSQIEKLMDNAMRKIGGIVASINARGCGEDEWSRLIKNYALGLLPEDDRDHQRVTAHLSECAACQRYVNGLRGLAAILPPLVLPLGPAAPTGHEGSILAHLEHLFHSHGTSAASAAGSAGAAGGAAAASTTVGAGGAGLVGSLGTGTLLKGGALVLAVGAAAVGVAVHTNTPNHHTRPHPHHTKAPPHIQAATPTPTTVLPPASTARSSNTAGAGSSTQAAAEFGFEKTARPQTSGTPTVQAPQPATTADVQTRSKPASSARVNREFGFEP